MLDRAACARGPVEMFGFPRRRALQLLPPLRSLDWDGAGLVLDLAAEAGAQVALEVDGTYFADVPVHEGKACFAFPFAPNAREAFDLMPCTARDGMPLLRAPARLVHGRRGAHAARTPPPALPGASGAEALLPAFGATLGPTEVAIVVPVHNATELVERCLASVLAHTTGRARLILIDDASSDPAIAPLLARHADLERVQVLRNEANLGFTATANRGIAEAGQADVVLLNADTEVGPNWLQGLRRAAHAADDIATATAVSDNAGAFSVPELEQANDLPAGWSFEDSARALWQHAGFAHPELPTGNGFCMYIRRSVLDAVGLLDEAAFAQGYGEENDFCQRASRHGLRHLVAGNVLVRHARSASFGDERRAALGRAGMAVLRERWPNYEADVGRQLFSFERRVLDWRVRRVFAQARAGNAPRPRILWVGAGAPKWDDAEVWNLRANGAENELVFEGRVVASNTWVAHDPEPSYRALWDWLQRYAFERLVVAEVKESAAEILCRLLDLPVARVDQPFAAGARVALDRAESDLRSFPDLAA
jgi:GT2 family glycosyltransferase